MVGGLNHHKQVLKSDVNNEWEVKHDNPKTSVSSKAGDGG